MTDRAASKQEPVAVDGETRHPPGFRLRRGRNWFFIGLTYASYYFNRYNLSFASSTLCNTFGFDNTNYGQIQSARSWCYALGQFLNGLLADRVGGRMTMAIGGYGTAVMNLLFGLVAYHQLAGPMMTTLGWFIVIRGIDGYIQAFGAPGMVKMNTAWFARSERGRFAGIFGLMINLGRYINNTVSPILLAGFTIWNYHSPQGMWQLVFFVPAGFIVVTTTLMLLLTKNTPEEAGYAGAVRHNDGAGDDASPLPLGLVFRTIMSNKFAWLTAWAYFCTGVVRYGVDDWFPKYFEEAQGIDLRSGVFQAVAFMIPTVATLGSIASGYASDLLFKGRRAPVAAFLYFAETAIILVGTQLSSLSGVSVALILVAFTCNATHSILGTAAAMDIGGRKMAGFAAGFIDSWQYIGAGLAGIGFGALIDAYGWGAWLYGMAGFGVLGGVLMIIMTVLENRASGVLQSGWNTPGREGR
ncbi:MAG TPA: MFS transporter [Phycisphaerae bacterium]|nr:MFS transporter [Phycisphaerae bacterium]